MEVPRAAAARSRAAMRVALGHYIATVVKPAHDHERVQLAG